MENILDIKIKNNEKIGIEETLRNGIASLVLTIPTLIQYWIYGVSSYAISFLCMFFLVFAFISYFRLNLKLFSPLMVISFYNAILMILFGRIFGQFDYLAVITANADVTKTFLNANYGKAIFVVVMSLLFAAYLYYFTWSNKGLKCINSPITIQRKKLIPLFIISVLPFFCVKQQELLSTYPFAVMSDLFITYKLEKNASSYSKLKYKNSGYVSKSEERPTFVLVIGESARRDAFGFNAPASNYASSPNLDLMVKNYPDNFAVFRNYISTGQSTVPTVLTMLNPLGSEGIMYCFEKPNLIKLLHGAGYDVSIVKNQDDRFLGKYLEISKSSSAAVGNISDREMIPLFEKVTNPEGRVIVLHTIGSHVSHCGLGTENYLNSILETDLFLKELFVKVLSYKTPICAWYVSDHGENLVSGDVHGSGNITLGELEVPSVIVANDAFKYAFPKKWSNLITNSKCLLSHNNLSQTIMGLMNVFPVEYYIDRRDISSDKFTEEENPLLTPNNMILIRYKSAIGKKQAILGTWN